MSQYSQLTVGVAIGLLWGVIIGMAIGSSGARGDMDLDAVAHGYAHYNLDHSWHWNNEGAHQ